MKLQLLALLLALLTLLNAGFALYQQKQTINAQKNAIEAADKSAQQLNAQLHREQQTVTALRTQSANNAQRQRELNNKLLQLETLSSTRLKTIEELQHENEELRNWASQPLPIVIARLRQRPAITGTHRYCEHLRSTSPLPTEPRLCPQ